MTTDDQHASATAAALNPTKLWQPSPALLASSHMTKFADFVAAKRQLPAVRFTATADPLAAYTALHAYSTERVSDFWLDVAEYTGVRWSTPPTASTVVVDERAHMATFPEWFAGCRLNFAEQLLRGPVNAPHRADQVAIIATTEALVLEKVTRAELEERTRRMAAAFKAAGVAIGDRIGGYIANCVDAAVAMLAAASLGAIWSSTSPDFGVTGVLDRFSQIQPKILFSINAVHYNGKVHDHLAKLAPVVAGLGDAVERVVVIPHIGSHTMDLSSLGPKAQSLESFLQMGKPDYKLEFVPLPFKHPLFILFSSGTTGKPKCIVHSAGGTLLQHLKEHVIHGNLGANDVFFQYTTTGWMMWNWLMSGLAVGSTIVLFDGSPFKPTSDVLWQLASRVGVTAFGTSAKYIQSMQDLKVDTSKYDLSRLHSIYSTGSPLKPESYDYVYKSIKQDLLLGSITGGTDIISLFAGHNTNLPVYRGELQCACLGMRIEAWDDNAQPLFGASGDLVCTRSFPCMPVYFWNDPNMEKYTKAYFEQFPKQGIWAHGDFVFVNPNTAGVVMLGRSDGTLNPSGVRFGSAELYNIIEQFPEVADSLVVGQKVGDDERVIMFLQMPEGTTLGRALVDAIKAKIRAQLSARHVPAVIVQVPDIPYTINGKKVEVAVKRIISGETVIPSGTLRNPESLEVYYKIPELKA
ncbi:acetoacetyl-CoA synthetase-like protein [Blastocladiella britannica]|nr:acetoacetyl-CoA synthetase-like protein [Blastocladiella britannica]